MIYYLLTFFFINTEGEKCFGFYNYFFNEWVNYADDGEICEGVIWLEPVIGHFFTDAELKERDKEVASKAFQAGLDFRNGINSFGAVANPYPDKETYINQL